MCYFILNSNDFYGVRFCVTYINCQLYDFTYIRHFWEISLHTVDFSICRSLVIMTRKKVMVVYQLKSGHSFMNNVLATHKRTKRKMMSGGTYMNRKSLRLLRILEKRSCLEREGSSTFMIF